MVRIDARRYEPKRLRLRLLAVAGRLGPDIVRTQIAVAWRKNDHNPLAANFLATIRGKAKAIRA
ncbi:hypothetical protein [Nonomuraea sp. CA-141351]|uniref:hypothetical protein n=1 Tax=Nonomuraea sp. CA-141351 TaxID=3239996 RepID=UPI003D8D92F0